MQKFPGALFWSRMAGRITNFSFRVGFYVVDLVKQAQCYDSVVKFLAEVAPTLNLTPVARSQQPKKHRVPGRKLWPGGIAGKIPPAPLTIGGCPYRILAGMAPGHNWGGA